jgi:hypothetical protein
MGNRDGRRTLFTIVAAAVLIAAGSGIAVASPAPGWRVTLTVGTSTAMTRTSNVVAVGPGDAFADFSGEAFTVSHWNGRSWRALPWPKSLRPYQSAIDVVGAIGASSASDLWVLKDNGRRAGVIRWNGHHWAVSALPSWSMRISGSGDFGVVPVISGPRSGWLFSLGYIAGPTPTYAAREINGKWRKVNLGGVPLGAVADGPDDIWVTITKGDLQPLHPKYTLLHWDGRRWQAEPAPAVTPPKGGDAFFGIAAVAGPRDVWGVISDVVGANPAKEHLLHWNGRSWTPVAAPGGTTFLGYFAIDGHGGLQAVANGPAKAYRWYFYHYSGGRWSKVAVPASGHLTVGQINVMTHVPGTSTMLAGGDLGTPQSGILGAIWQYGA